MAESQVNFANSTLLTTPLCVPSLPEQRRIADILETLDAAIRRTEQIIAKLKQIKQGLLHDLLTRGIDENGELRDPERHPEQFRETQIGVGPAGWDVCPLGAVADVIDPNPSHRYPNEVAEGVPIVSTENFEGEDDYDLSKSKCVPERIFFSQAARCSFTQEDVVFARKGRIGFARPYGTQRKVFSHTIVLMKPKGCALTPRFLLWSVRADSFFSGIRLRMNTNLGVPTLGVELLGSVPIPLPREREQKAIAQALDATAQSIGDEQRHAAKLHLLKQGLMEDLLTGRVRVTELEVAA